MLYRKEQKSGGAVATDMLVTSYTLLRSLPKGDSEDYDPFVGALTLDASSPRAMSNLLRPRNVPGGIPIAVHGEESDGT